MSQLITEEYKRLNQELHATRLDYGCKSSRHATAVINLVQRVEGSTVLDYGCGKGDLVKYLNNHTAYSVTGYDPGHPRYSETQVAPVDVVVCTDVLEHIEPTLVDNVLRDLDINSRKAMYLHVATRYDKSKLLPDGTNPHKVVEQTSWWLCKFKSVFSRHKVIMLRDVAGKSFTCLIIKTENKLLTPR
jgi:2-polyprenyl-3-methyl-5-hydroxy-6-metoxy-1,4-benzoquinol methylase